MSSDYDNTISVDNLVKSYGSGKNAVDGISFHVGRGEIYGFLGKNGAGKTTTIRVLTTLVPPTSGTVNVLGMDVVHRATQIRKRIGVVAQHESYDFATIERNMKIYGMLWQVPSEVLSSRIEELIDLFDLERIRKHRAFEVSGGEKKKLQVAREFLHDMDLLFLDEPTVGMDPIMRRKVLDYVRKKSKEGLSVFFTTHILEEADYICDRISIIDRGKILAEGTTQFLKDNFGQLKTLEIEVSGSGSFTKEELKSNIGELENSRELIVNGNHITVVGKNMDRALENLILYLNRIGSRAERINLRESSLDDVFLEVVSK
ncbi:putative branched-chain amino acid transport ATP-binding protein LivG [Thermoplasmatales archaeon]|nr:putative branched-chain amino acid transport ATP-binding protein LivG [Thermoplasmatales archaeon]